AATAANTARDLRVSRFAITPFAIAFGGFDPHDVGQAIVEGISLALYRYDRFKSDNGSGRPLDLESVAICPARYGVTGQGLRAGVEDGLKLAAATVTARDLAILHRSEEHTSELQSRQYL